MMVNKMSQLRQIWVPFEIDYQFLLSHHEIDEIHALLKSRIVRKWMKFKLHVD